jgi:flagellar biosynthesis component FlhA
MRRLVLIASIALSLGLAGVATAQTANGIRYRWVDATGLPHYSDSLTEDALKFGYDVINNNGMVVTHVGRQLSPAERAAADKQAAEQAARQSAIDAQKRHDLQLLNTYPDEDAFKAEQQQVLESLDEQMNTTLANLHTQDAALTDLLNHAADDERAKQPVPKFLSDQITAQRNVVANERALLQRQKANRDTIVQQQAQELQHYRELKAAEKADRGY